MRHSPVSILRFLVNYYESLKRLFDHAKESRTVIVTSEKLYQFGFEELKNKLVDYKILRSLPGGDYRFEKRYFDFLSFLVSDFSLPLPAQLAKYKHSLTTLFHQLQQAKKPKEISLFAEKLTEEAGEFVTHLETNTAALEKEVDELRNIKRQHLSYTAQVQKASYLAKNFLDPLNRILDQHEDAIVHLIRKIREYAHEQIRVALDSYEAAPFVSLYGHLVMVATEIEKHLDFLVDSLLPLLDQIKITNPIIKGLKIFRDAYEKGQEARYQLFLPKLHDRNTRSLPIRDDYELAAENILQNFVAQPPVVIYEPEPNNIWCFDEELYQKELTESLPIDNFFLWCKQTLRQKEPDIDIDLYKFFKIVNLLFKNQFNTTFTSKKVTLQFTDAQLLVPYLNITKN